MRPGPTGRPKSQGSSLFDRWAPVGCLRVRVHDVPRDLPPPWRQPCTPHRRPAAASLSFRQRCAVETCAGSSSVHALLATSTASGHSAARATVGGCARGQGGLEGCIGGWDRAGVGFEGCVGGWSRGGWARGLRRGLRRRLDWSRRVGRRVAGRSALGFAGRSREGCFLEVGLAGGLPWRFNCSKQLILGFPRKQGQFILHI